MSSRQRASGPSRKRRKRQLPPASLLRLLWESAWGRAILFGSLLAFLVYAGLLYFFVVSPSGSPWRWFYGEPKAPEGYSIRGIDVSHHQGDINWDKLQGAEIGGETINFVFVKATEGRSLLDKNFNENFFQAREHGFIRGAYHFFSPYSSGREQAHFFLRQVHLEEGDMAPVLDVEKIGKLTAGQLQREVLEWLRIVEERYGVKPIIYSGAKFKKDYLDIPEINAYPYWIAHYYVERQAYEGEWKFWQYTDCGRLPGIKGDVDLNIYNGSMYDLRQLTVPEAEE